MASIVAESNSRVAETHCTALMVPCIDLELDRWRDSRFVDNQQGSQPRVASTDWTRLSFQIHWGSVALCSGRGTWRSRTWSRRGELSVEAEDWGGLA